MRWTATGLAMLMLVGCDNRSSSSTAAPGGNSSGTPTTSSVVTTPTTLPTTRPFAILTIDGRPVEFPPTKLVVTKKAGQLSAVLCSDDPPMAIDPNYHGNSFMMEMRLDIEDPADLPTAVWTYQAPNDKPADSVNGIFLNGAREQMQPIDVKVTFARQGDDIIAKIDGKFVRFESHDVSSSTQTETVAGTLNVVLNER